MLDNADQLILIGKYQKFISKYENKYLSFNDAAIIWIAKFAKMYRDIKERKTDELFNDVNNSYSLLVD